MKKNIIHKVQVEINTTSMATANTVKSTMDEIIHTQILPSVEAIVERLSARLHADESLQINTLTVDINVQRSQLESKSVLSEIEEQLERIMTKIQQEKTVDFIPSDKNQLSDIQYPLFSERSISTHTKQLESLFFFLKTGMKPWWISDSATMKALLLPETIVPIAIKEPEVFSRLFTREIHLATTRKRLILQFPDSVVTQLVTAAYSSASVSTSFLQQLKVLPTLLKGVNNVVRTTIWEVILTQLQEVSTQHRNADVISVIHPIIRSITPRMTTAELESVWESLAEPIIRSILSLRNEPDSAIEAIRKVFMEQSESRNAENTSDSKQSPEESNSEKVLPPTKSDTVNQQLPAEDRKTHAEQPNQTGQSIMSIPEEGMLFEHAGLVLLSPFLKHLFTHIGLMDDNNQLTDKTMAAHVLYYVATGNEEPWEFDATFEKYIVGIDFNEPLERHCAISDTVKTEVKSMLQAVKDNWPPMQKSSDELLRYEYLQRPGKLIIDGQQHRLVMERKTQDILLDKLSWAISIVRFPWNKELLYVEW